MDGQMSSNDSTINGSSYNLLLILPVTLSAIWVLIDLFYTSWLLALIANFVTNACLPKGTGVHIGRLKISLLTGRIIFKDVQYYDRDNSLFITDGYGVLRWWKKEPVIDDSTVRCKRCGSQSKAGVGKESSLVFLQLNGVEYHWYNRKEVYDEWGKPKVEENENEDGSGLAWIKQLRPSIHCSINKGRISVGNHLTERTLVVYVQHAEGHYTMAEASNRYDELMHVVRWHGDKLRAVLEPSVGYNGPHYEVPSCGEVGGDGHTRGSYLLLKTDSAEGVYSLDIPGLVPMNDTSSPKFALDVFLGCNSVINYGSYANRQRTNLIQKFFFPNDYTVPPVSRIPQPGERRIYTSFDVSVYVVSNATLNLFFEEKKEIQCLTFRVGGDSCLCINQPWITKDNGYTTTIKGKATDIEALTSLPYEPLGRCQVFEIKTELFFPRVWNSTQKWVMKFGLSTVQANILFQYIDFFNALLDDWLGSDPPDLLEFVPLDWNIDIDMNDYEVFLYSSPYNWIDITTEGRENTRLAFCGKTGHMSFEFPFAEFLPIEQRVTFTARGQNIVLRKYLPPSCSTRDSQFQLSSCCKNRWRIMDPPEDRSPLAEKKLLRSVSQPLQIFDPQLLKEKFEGGAKVTGDVLKSDSFKRQHIRRGSEPLLTKAQIQQSSFPLKDMGLLMEGITEEDGDTQETELTEKLMKPTPQSSNGASNEFFPMGYRMETQYEDGWLEIGCGPELLIEINYRGHNYDPTVFKDDVNGEERMVPNEVHINVEASSVLLRVFGSLANDLIALRDNFVSEYMFFKTYFSESVSAPDGTKEESQPPDLTRTPDTSTGPNIPTERFLNVFVDFKLNNIMGELPAHLPDNLPNDFPLVSGMSELFSVHVEYMESETRVHLHVDPITVNSPAPSNKMGSNDHSLGYLALSSVDFRCHGFTEYLLKERLEYAWIMKLDLGQITGTVSAHQLLPVIDFFQTAANHILSNGDDFVKPPDAVLVEPLAEPLSELIKYKLFAVNISTINVNIKERDSLMKLKSTGFSLDLCNLHNNVQTLAVSLQLHHVNVTSFISPPSNPSVLIECGHANVGTVRADVGLREPEEAMAERQLAFLKRADSHSRRLWFLWDDQYNCGCCGGCLFLSSSIERLREPNVHDSLNNLLLDTPGATKDGSSSTAIFLAQPSQFAFKSLQTLQHLHSTLVSHHFSSNQRPQFLRGVSIEDTPTRLPPATSLPSINVIQEDSLSQDSDNDSFHSAQEYLVDSMNEEYHSSHNTPRGSVRQHSRQHSKHSIQTGGGNTGTLPSPKATTFPSHYEKVLNSYKCRWKTVKLYWKAGFKETPPTEPKPNGSGFRFAAGVTPKRSKKSVSGPRFILEVPEFTSAIERLQYSLSDHQMKTDDHSASSASPSSPKTTPHRKMRSSEDSSEESAMFSVEVDIGTFDMFLSPLLVQVIDRYVNCANLFFTTRSAHLLLETLSLEGLGSIQSHVKKIKKTSTTSSIPSHSQSPLAHLFINMSPSAHGSVQILQTSKILTPPGRSPSLRDIDGDLNYRTSVVCLYTSGLQGNTLIHHNSIVVNPGNTSESANLQMTVKLAGKLCLPVFQAGMFAINSAPRGQEGEAPSGITRNYSFLDFDIDPSSCPSGSVSVTNVAEVSMNKFQLTTAAKIIQSEFSSSPILMWSDIPNEDTDKAAKQSNVTRDKNERDSEQTNNSMFINMSVPSVRLQLAGPKHGVPSHNELCVDASLLYSLVEAWKPSIEDFVTMVKGFWQNKIKRDRQLMLGLIMAAMEISYRKKTRNPLLTQLSCSLRESIVYSVVQQLWSGLSLATADRISTLPSQYQEGFLLQEIVGTLISLALRLNVQRSSLSAVPCIDHRQSRQATTAASEEGGTQGYFSISPSASELAILNSSFSKQGNVNIDYTKLINGSSTQCLLYIRETLLPLFLACNVKIAPQLNQQCHNSLKLNMDYHIRLEEAAILVMDGREDRSLDSVDDSVGVVPEFLLDQLYIAGSLEHVKESRVIVQSSGHLVTIRSNNDSNKGRKLRSNITSKCYLGLDTIATHLTLPLLMLFRHTSCSLHHWRKSFQSIKIAKDTRSSNDQPLINIGQVNEFNPDSGGHNNSWITTAQTLVEVLLAIEKRKSSVPPTTPPPTTNSKVSSSKQATPRSSQRNLNAAVASTSPNYPLSTKALGAIAKTYGLEEIDTTTNRRPSVDSSSSRESPPVSKIPGGSNNQPVLVQYDNNDSVTSPGGLEMPEDTTDSAHVFSSDPEAPIQTSMATYAKKTTDPKKLSLTAINPVDFVPELSPVVEMPNMNEILAIPDNQLEFSVCGSIRVKSLQVSSGVETLIVMLEVRNISGAIDCRQIPTDSKPNEQGGVSFSDHTPLLYKLLPTYLSVSSTLQQCCVRVFDSAVSQGDLAVLSVNPLELCTSLYYDGNKQPAPAYRALFRLPRVELDMKEPPIILHKMFHKYIPTFTGIFNELLAPGVNSVLDDKLFVASTPSTMTVSDLQFPPHLPRGSFLFKLAWFRMIVRPLSTLTVQYQLAPVTAQLGTSSVIKFSMNIGQHNLEFTPKESKDELSLRNIPLPTIALKGSIIPRPSSRLPSISAELAMKQVVVDVTTDVFNQLLLLQTSFIKEFNDLINMFFNIGESIPQERLSSINLKQSTESGFELISLLSSVKLSLQGIKITISTPTQTALRFSTGNKIEMLITNPSHQTNQQDKTNNRAAVDQLTLHGKVETEISVSLGFLQDDPGEDEEDDFVELAYFKTWITVKNTLQQNTLLLAELGEGVYPASLDTFLISIIAPHLYIQSTAVEKAILFWVNCKSVYNYWQNEHKVLNAEVQAATEEFMERFKTKPAAQIRAPSFDFSKPRLVQISVNDVGACMPLVALPTTPHSSQKGFPALVLTIKDMQVILNLSKKLGSAGRFSDFCIRFDERFHFRHKTWTIDPKKHKSLNYGVVPNGTYRFSIVNQPRQDDEGGEKLFSSFTWHMSGIHTNSTTMVGRHISTLVRTLTAIGSDLDESQHQHDVTSSSTSPVTPATPSPATLPRTSVRRRYSYSNFEEEDVLRALEVDLAKQTRKLQKLRQSGATPDSLKNEEDNFHKLEVGIARELRRVFRKGRGMSFQQWGQLLYPRSPTPLSLARKPFGTLPRRKVTFEDPEVTHVPTALFPPHPLTQSHSPRTHARHRSDITPDMKRLIRKEQETANLLTESTSSGANLEAVMEGNENEQEEEKKSESKPKISGEGSRAAPTESLIPPIDIEINVTIKVDSGEVILLSEDVSSHDQKLGSSLGVMDSPLLGSRRPKQTPSSVHTVLFIPAVEVKAHYQSILGSTYSTAPPSPSKPVSNSPDKHPMADIRVPVKKGVLSVVTIISSLHNDLKLNPSILDFIEQVVRPINISAQEIETAASTADFEEEDEKEGTSELPVVAKRSDGHPLSFPVDVNLNFQVLPSKIILTCNPHARVQCQLVIPTVSFVVSFSLFTKRHYDTSLSPPTLISPNDTTSLSMSPQESSITSVNPTGLDDTTTINNINVTGCLQTFQLTMFTPTSLRNGQSEDKEVISLVLGQAFIHLSRSSVFVNERLPCRSIDDYVTTEKLKVSVIPHIESLILFYDWRRLNDVTWFRKCWYHTGLVEAIFIGRKPTEEPPMPHPPSPYRASDRQMWSPGSSVEDSSASEPSTGETTSTITAELVVAVSVADMRLAANVAQLMGNAYIQVSHLRGVAHADIKDNELVFLDVDGTLEDFEIDAQGGVVAGNLRVNDTAISLNSSTQTGCIPKHRASGTIQEIKGHIDYMSAIILLLKGTNVNINVWDSWEGINLDRSEHTAAKIQVCCSFDWSACQISIHRATAKGMFGILQRIYDFVVQQKKRSERTIGSMIPAGTAASTIFANYQAEQKRAEKTRAAEIENPLFEYHHWMWAVKVGSIKLMNALGIQISAHQHDVSLGGVINMSGENLSVVCFHGTSFRETEWVVFNIDMISAMFSTLAIPGLGSSLFHSDDPNDGLDKDSKRRICQQVCILSLGNETSKLTELAAIYRVTAGRGGVPPVSPKEISEWLNYVCINHYLSSVNTSISKPVGYLKESQKLVIQPISCLPACSLKLINDHLWPSIRQLEEQVMKGIMESATVECTLVTKFSDGIAVTTTVENYLFLHDLFTAYIDYLEKQNVSFRPPFTQSSSSFASDEDNEKSSNCLRKFVSVHWELDPRIVLLATAQWASGHFNPHITWVLEKLGFKHARTTIPKYIQRGLMDPLDLGIASIVELLIELSATKKVRIVDEHSV